MNCPKCKRPALANTRFCGSCGQPLDAVTAPVPLPPSIASTTSASAAATAAASRTWADARASAPGLLSRMMNIVLTPKTEWLNVASEPTSIAELFVGYVTPLAVLAALVSFARMSVLGVNTAFGRSLRIPISTALTYTVMTFVSVAIVVFLVGLIINALAPTFSGQRDRRQALRVSAYSLTPALLSSVLAFSPILPTLLQFISGCYGVYVLSLGLPALMQSPKEKSLGYAASVVICTLLLGVALAMVSVFAHIGGAKVALLGANASERGVASAADQAASRDQSAAILGNTIGNMLGTDDQGKSGLSAAVSNLVKAGEQSETRLPSSGNVSAAAGQTSTTSDAPQNAQSPLSATGGLLTAVGGALGGPNRVATVDFKMLTSLLPTALPGMKRTAAQGQNQGAMGVKTSSATGDYKGSDGAGVHIEIADISGVSGLIDLAGGLIQSTTSESDSGYEKDVVLGGRRVHEKYDANSKKSDLSLTLAKRFAVDISGDGVDMPALERSLGQIDLGRLESMKDAGAQPK